MQNSSSRSLLTGTFEVSFPLEQIFKCILADKHTRTCHVWRNLQQSIFNNIQAQQSQQSQPAERMIYH